MKPAPFSYHAPRTISETTDLLAAHGGTARLIAGGQSLVPQLSFRTAKPAALIDLRQCAGLRELCLKDGNLVCGSMNTQIAVERSELAQTWSPLLALAIPFIGSRTTRNRGTIGGSLSNAGKSAELPAVALCLDATMIAAGPNGRRSIPAEAFFIADQKTALNFDELLCEIHFPITAGDWGIGFVETATRAHGVALLGVAVSLKFNGDICEDARVVAFAAGPRPQRLLPVETSLIGNDLSDRALASAAGKGAEFMQADDDLHATAAYRRQILSDMIANALRAACERRVTIGRRNG